MKNKISSNSKGILGLTSWVIYLSFICLSITSYAQIKKPTKSKAAVSNPQNIKKKVITTDKPSNFSKIDTVAKSRIDDIKEFSSSDFNKLPEKEMIRQLDSIYPNAIAPSYDLKKLLENEKFDVAAYLIKHFEVKPIQQNLIQINYSKSNDTKKFIKNSPSCGTTKEFKPNESSNKKLTLAKLIISKGIYPDLQALRSSSQNNELPLFELYFKNYKDTTARLSDKDKLVSQKEAGAMMLVDVCDFGYLDLVKFLIAEKIDVNGLDLSEGDFFPIYRAVKYVEVFKYLVDNGADVKKKGYGGNALVHAAREGCIDTIQYLLDQRMDPNEVIGKMSAFDMAKKYNTKNSADVLSLFKTYKN